MAGYSLRGYGGYTTTASFQFFAPADVVGACTQLKMYVTSKTQQGFFLTTLGAILMM